MYSKKFPLRAIVLSLVVISFFASIRSIDQTHHDAFGLDQKIEVTIPRGTLSISQLYRDAEYAWNKLQTRRDLYGSIKTNLYYRTRVTTNYNYTEAETLGLLQVFYAMYKITNASHFLDSAWEMLQTIENYSTRTLSWGNKTIEVNFGYNWKTDTPINSTVRYFGALIPIALEDSRFIPYFEKLISSSHEIFRSPINLIYNELNSTDGSVLSSDFHITWKNSGHRKISQLLWIYEVTGNETYKLWADETIEAVWGLRSPTTNLIPRMVNAETGVVLDPTISHYDMANWLGVLELAYFLSGHNDSAGTGVNTYYDLIEKTASAIANYMWKSGSDRWVYKCTYTDGSQRDIPEMNSILVDYVMIRAHEITGINDFLQKAITGFDTEFMGTDPVIPNGVLMHNSLVIHSPSTYSTQSQFSASSNLMVARTAYLVYLYTRNDTYLEKSNVHYQQFMSKHRFEKGYTSMLNTRTMKPYDSYLGNPAIVWDYAPAEAILALQNTIIPSPEVNIDWGYGLSTSLPNEYASPGAFTGVSVNINQTRVWLESVDAGVGGSIFLNFSRNGVIDSVLMDGQDYTQYLGNILYPTTGLHSYLISFYAPIPPPIRWTNVSSSSSGTKSATESSTSSDNSSSSSLTSSTITNTSEFTIQPLIGGLILVLIIHRRLRQKKS